METNLLREIDLLRRSESASDSHFLKTTLGRTTVNIALPSSPTILTSIQPQTTMRVPLSPPTYDDPQTTFTAGFSSYENIHGHEPRLPMSIDAFPDIPFPVTRSPTRLRHQPHSQSLPSFPPYLPTSFHEGSIDAQPQPPRPSSIPIPFSPLSHAAPVAATRERWSPPPLNIKKAPFRCVPLPEMVRGPVTLDYTLAYSSGHPAENASKREVDARRRHHHQHSCAPATNPCLSSMTILLSDGRVRTIHASHKSFVTVGDVLDALDEIFLRKLPKGAGSCSCLSLDTALHSFRKNHRRAGLTKNTGGSDIWDLQIG